MAYNIPQDKIDSLSNLISEETEDEMKRVVTKEGIENLGKIITDDVVSFEDFVNSPEFIAIEDASSGIPRTQEFMDMVKNINLSAAEQLLNIWLKEEEKTELLILMDDFNIDKHRDCGEKKCWHKMGFLIGRIKDRNVLLNTLLDQCPSRFTDRLCEIIRAPIVF